MKKTSIYLEPELDEAVARRAADEGLSKSEFIRRTLTSATQRPKRPMPTFGVFNSGLGDVSANVDAYLEKWGFGEIDHDR